LHLPYEVPSLQVFAAKTPENIETKTNPTNNNAVLFILSPLLQMSIGNLIIAD